jgi:hypothetical protein
MKVYCRLLATLAAITVSVLDVAIFYAAYEMHSDMGILGLVPVFPGVLVFIVSNGLWMVVVKAWKDDITISEAMLRV